MNPRISLHQLAFTGPNREPAIVPFGERLSVLYGASNTGKSFTVKALDFMLGSSRPLPDISEKAGFDRISLAITAGGEGDVTLLRPLAGGNFDYMEGWHTDPPRGSNQTLSARHDPLKDDSVSALLLRSIGLWEKKVAVDANGKKRGLSFRDVARYCMTDETTIQSEESPALSGQFQTGTVEKSVFKLLVTGVDDSALVEVTDGRTLRTSVKAKAELIEEMISSLSDDLSSNFPDEGELADQEQKLDAAYEGAREEIDAAQSSIRARMARKREIAAHVSAVEDRLSDIENTLTKFAQLDEVYRSDLSRLESLEEAGFLLMLGGEHDCPLCGATPSEQHHEHSLKDVERIRGAAATEIRKIQGQRVDLQLTVEDLAGERAVILGEQPLAYSALEEIEAELESLAPAAIEARRNLEQIIEGRDRVKRGLSLIDQRATLQARLDELAKIKPATRAEKPTLGIDAASAHAFAQVVSDVLKKWQFPGDCHVSFDLDAHDLRIDGKLRRDNGKGVRAITHSAFKVALLMHCRANNLPHPGFLILDTPLLTYRDPISHKGGDLSRDEQVIASTSLKTHFFDHLLSLGDLGQFVIVENVDPPAGIEGKAAVEVFGGSGSSGRAGLFTQP